MDYRQGNYRVSQCFSHKDQAQEPAKTEHAIDEAINYL